jgi:uncharacterized protein (TIGR04255 family)
MLNERAQSMENLQRIVDFENPPVVETVLGVFFSPLAGYGPLHQGIFWDRVRSRYPRYELMPAIGEVEVRLGPQGVQPFPVRSLLIDNSNAQLVQLQSNGFLRNWRKVPGVPGYIHYDVMRPSFEGDWIEFLDFLGDEQLASPEVFEAQVTYINQFVRGVEWEAYEDFRKILTGWAAFRQSEIVSNLKLLSFHEVYELRDGSGRLELAAQPAIRPADGKEILQLTITAAGKPQSSSTADIMTWLDSGHAAVVGSFVEATSPEAHKIWGRK